MELGSGHGASSNPCMRRSRLVRTCVQDVRKRYACTCGRLARRGSSEAERGGKRISLALQRCSMPLIVKKPCGLHAGSPHSSVHGPVKTKYGYHLVLINKRRELPLTSASIPYTKVCMHTVADTIEPVGLSSSCMRKAGHYSTWSAEFLSCKLLSKRTLAALAFERTIAYKYIFDYTCTSPGSIN
eukprot:6214812-Pleurochrysis_carterae.AAC.5